MLCLQVWSLKVEQEVEKNKALTEALQTLATENHELKQSLSKRRKSSNLSTLNEDDFYDAVSGQRPLGGSNQSMCVVCLVGWERSKMQLLFSTARKHAYNQMDLEMRQVTSLFADFLL